MSDTPAWQAILAATTTGTVVGAVITQGFTIWKSRIEADNQRKKAYEGRAWNAKHAALKRLVTACRSVRFRADEQPNDADFRRGATVKGLEMFRDEIGGDDGIGEVVLYADPQVEAKLDELLHTADTVPAKFPDQLAEVERIGDALYGLGKESLTPEQRVARRKELDADRDEAFTKLGVASKSDLNVEKLFRFVQRPDRPREARLAGCSDAARRGCLDGRRSSGCGVGRRPPGRLVGAPGGARDKLRAQRVVSVRGVRGVLAVVAGGVGHAVFVATAMT